MSLVLDSSVTLAWIYDDETTDAIRQVFAAVATMARLFRLYGASRSATA